MNKKIRRFLRSLPIVWLLIDACEDRALARAMRERAKQKRPLNVRHDSENVVLEQDIESDLKSDLERAISLLGKKVVFMDRGNKPRKGTAISFSVSSDEGVKIDIVYAQKYALPTESDIISKAVSDIIFDDKSADDTALSWKITCLPIREF
jgi:hypothetical protein